VRHLAHAVAEDADALDLGLDDVAALEEGPADFMAKPTPLGVPVNSR
jgi:hypothetical protein